MKILWHMPVLRRFGCGLSIRAVELAQRLVALGHEVHFVVSRCKSDVEGGSIRNIPVRMLDLPGVRPVHWSLQSLARRAGARSVVSRIDMDHDLFLSCQPEVISAYAAMGVRHPALFVCGGTTLLHDEADLDRLQGSWIVRMAASLDRRLKHANERLAFKSADAAIFDSLHTRDRVACAYEIARDKLHTVYGGFNSAALMPVNDAAKRKIRAEMGIAPDDVVLCWTGRFSPEKNVGMLVDSVSQCREQLDALLLVGDGPCRKQIKDHVARLGLEETVRFIGLTDNVRPYLHAADAFVFPSTGESFGASLVEAMACGLACIALRPDAEMVRTAANEIFDNGRCGIIVDSPTPDSLARGIDHLVGNPDLRTKLGAAARAFVADRFTWDVAGMRFNQIVNELVNRKRREEKSAPEAACPSVG